MKNIILATILVLGLIASVSATISLDSTFKVNLAQMNGDADGQVFGWNYNQMQVIAMGVKPNTNYVLAYTTQNKPNYAICIGTVKSTKMWVAGKKNDGVLSKIFNFNFKPLLTNNKEDLLFLAKASDVNCNQHKILSTKDTLYAKTKI